MTKSEATAIAELIMAASDGLDRATQRLIKLQAHLIRELGEERAREFLDLEWVPVTVGDVTVNTIKTELLDVGDAVSGIAKIVAPALKALAPIEHALNDLVMIAAAGLDQ